MPLVVPVLRLAYVFLNVFETFKTLRLPRPSARNGGQPSARAMSARKRAMKGCTETWYTRLVLHLLNRARFSSMEKMPVVWVAGDKETTSITFPQPGLC